MSEKIYLRTCTIVIATIGEETLPRLIESIEKSSLHPKEVLLAFPPKAALKTKLNSRYFEIKYLISEKRGQVFQRNFALEHVSSPIIFQLDSDIVLEANTIQLLVDKLIDLGPGNLVAPALHPPYLHQKTLVNSIYDFLKCMLIDSSQRITKVRITKAGVPYFPADLHADSQDLIEVEWVHSIRLYFNSDKISRDYYPFGGKAYLEDVIQALEFKKNYVKLWLMPSAKVWHRPEINDASVLSNQGDRAIQRWITATYGYSRIRLEAYYVLTSLKKIVSGIKNILNDVLNR